MKRPILSNRQSGEQISSRTLLSLILCLASDLYSTGTSGAERGSLKPLMIRGSAFEMPLWIGTTMYDNHRRAYEAEDSAGVGLWYDRALWAQRFEAMERQGLSVVAVTHPHPYPAFVRLSEFPEAAGGGGDTVFARNRDMLQWIIDEGRKHGVSLYFLTWNICLPSRLASARGRRFVLLEPVKYDDCAPFFGLHGQAATAIDNMRLFRIRPLTDGT